jgi:hypothetical protein
MGDKKGAGMDLCRSGRSVVVALFGLSVLAPVVQAQDWFMDWAFEQSFSGSDPFRSPGGFTASAGAIALAGPFGVHATYRNVSDGGDDLTQDCVGAAAGCVPGTLSVSYDMRTVGVGVSYDFINPTDVMLTLALTGTRNWPTERIRHVVTGQRFRNDLASTLGFIASAHLRLRPVLGGIRPEFSVHYDRSGGGDCAADAACWGGRSAFGVSVGFGWVLRASRED